MRRGKRGAALAAALTLAATLMLGVTPANAKGSHSHHTTKAPALVQQGHGTFWECPAKVSRLLIAVNHLTLRPGQELTMNFIVRNTGAKPCNYVAPYAGSQSSVTASTLEVGPCGSMGFEIEGAHHRNVWPGDQPFNCPALGFAQLQPNGTVQGTGMWGQTVPTGQKRVPAGAYTLIIDGHFKFPLRIAAH